MKPQKIAVLVGSLREESYTLKVAKALIQLAPKSLDLSILKIGDLPLYNEDLDAHPPEAWTRFRNELNAVEGVLFLTPEYNRSIPAVLKNAIDVGSRPKEKSVWNAKPAGIVSVSPSSMGGFGANHHLRQTLVFLNMPTMQQPEAYIGEITKHLDAKGEITTSSTKEFCEKFMLALAKWIAKMT